MVELKPLFNKKKKTYFRRIVEIKPLFYEKKAYFRRIVCVFYRPDSANFHKIFLIFLILMRGIFLNLNINYDYAYFSTVPCLKIVFMLKGSK